MLDTHVLLWASSRSSHLSPNIRAALAAVENELLFSAASLWELSIKRGLGRTDFKVDPRVLRRGLLSAGYIELPVTGAHAVAVDLLPPLHKDPFDRILVAQALAEGVTLVTRDALVAQYPVALMRA